MNIAIVSGSGRSNSESRRVSDFITTVLNSKNIDTDIIDLSESVISTKLDDVWSNENGLGDLVKQLTAKLEVADAAVFVTPEWNGMASPALVNFLQHVGQTLAHKPVLLVGVSSTRGGTYPIAQLRSFSAKNSHAVYIPEHLIFRDINNLLKGEAVTDSDIYMRERTDFALVELTNYAEALKQMRANMQVTPEKFANGM